MYQILRPTETSIFLPKLRTFHARPRSADSFYTDLISSRVATYVFSMPFLSTQAGIRIDQRPV